jgi:hypothetical protein
MVTSHEFQEGIPVPFDLPESSPGTTVAVVDQNPSQVRRDPGTWGSQTWNRSIRKALCIWIPQEWLETLTGVGCGHGNTLGPKTRHSVLKNSDVCELISGLVRGSIDTHLKPSGFC